MKINTFVRGGVYTAPEIEILDIAFEKGFAQSLTGDGIDNLTEKDYGTY